MHHTFAAGTRTVMALSRKPARSDGACATSTQRVSDLLMYCGRRMISDEVPVQFRLKGLQDGGCCQRFCRRREWMDKAMKGKCRALSIRALSGQTLVGALT